MANTSKAALESVTHFYCNKCETVRPLKQKPRVVETKGRYVLCDGDFVCAKCEFRMSTYCEVCGAIQLVEIEEPWMDGTDEYLAGDVLCSVCRSILVTLEKPAKRADRKRSTAETTA